jgi:hypothetical protein
MIVNILKECSPSSNKMPSSLMFLRDDSGLIYSFCPAHTHLFFCTDCDTTVDYKGQTCEMCTHCSFCNWKPVESGFQNFCRYGDELACMSCFNEMETEYGTQPIYNCRLCTRARVYGPTTYTKGMCWECRPTAKWPGFTPIR